MKLKSIRYIVVSLVALFAAVGAVNAVGVFYYDSAANQFVLDGSLKISDPGSFKLLLRELNSTDDSNLYINGRKDVQIRLDADNSDSLSKFNINNGANGTVFKVDELGKINTGIPTVLDSDTRVNGMLTVTGSGFFNALTSTGAASLGSLTTGAATVNSLRSGSAINVPGVTFTQNDGTLYYPGTDNVMNTSRFFRSSGDFGKGRGVEGIFYWGTSARTNAYNYMALSDNGDLHIRGDLYTGSAEGGTKMTGGAGGGGTLACTTLPHGKGSVATQQSGACSDGTTDRGTLVSFECRAYGNASASDLNTAYLGFTASGQYYYNYPGAVNGNAVTCSGRPNIQTEVATTCCKIQ